MFHCKTINSAYLWPLMRTALFSKHKTLNKHKCENDTFVVKMLLKTRSLRLHMVDHHEISRFREKNKHVWRFCVCGPRRTDEHECVSHANLIDWLSMQKKQTKKTTFWFQTSRYRFTVLIQSSPQQQRSSNKASLINSGYLSCDSEHNPTSTSERI